LHLTKSIYNIVLAGKPGSYSVFYTQKSIQTCILI